MNFFIIFFIIKWWCLASNEAAGKLVYLMFITCTYVAMKLAFIIAIIIMLINLMSMITVPVGNECKPLPEIMEIKKHLGSPFKFRCNSACKGSYSIFHRNHTSKEFHLVSQSYNNLYNIPALSFHDGGEYCCSEKCDGTNHISNFKKCCIRIKSKK